MAAASEGNRRLSYLAVIVYLVALSAHACHALTIHRSGMHGVIVTPGHPDPYEDNQDLKWLITVPEGYRVRLYVSEFDLEPGTLECDEDYLTVLSANETLGKFCGRAGSSHAPGDRSLTSQSREMEVRFHSDYSNVNRHTGFRAHYVAEDIDECQQDSSICNHFCHNYLGGYYCSCEFGYSLHEDQASCEVHCSGNVLESASGVIMSPGYPVAYPRQSECDWLIRAEAGYLVSLTFEDFDVEDHPDNDTDCPYDALRINQDDQPLGPFCGRERDKWPTGIQSDTLIKIYFRSDDSGEYRGFRASYISTGKPCVALHAPAYGTVTGSNSTVWNNATFSCEVGFRLVGPTQTTCLPSGNWSDSSPTCEEVRCENLDDISNGQVAVDAIRGWGTHAVYSCDPLYELSGSNTRDCQVNGEWSGKPPSCVPICGVSNIRPRLPPGRRIVGGREAKRKSWPWIVQLVIRAPNFGIDNRQCGGSLLSEQWVLTAAHCVTVTAREEIHGRLLPADTVSATLGLHRISDNNGIVREVSEIVRAPNYNPRSYDADVALLRLAQPIRLSSRIRPICIPDLDTFLAGPDYSIFEETPEAEAVAIGWGQITVQIGDSTTSDVLKEVYIPVIAQTTCVDAFKEGWITENMVCAGAAEGGRDTCFGDSGGPLMLKNFDERYYAFGLISWGESRCAQGDYGVYVKVSNFAEWIREITQI